MSQDTAELADLDDHSLAAEIAAIAGRALVEVRLQGEAERWDQKRLKDEGDRRSHELIVALLASARPADAVLSEEGADDRVRLSAERTWIVDPLDGTREFSELGRSDWAIHVALWTRAADDLVAGAVDQPGLGTTFRTGSAIELAPAPERPRLVVSRTRPPAVSDQVAAALDAELVPMGSAGAKVISIVRGVADVYVHAGGQYEWDSAAPVAVARAAGLFTSRIDGSPLRYNQPDVSLPDLIVCRPELADAVLAAVAAG